MREKRNARARAPPVGNVDFSLLEPLDQIVGRQINQFDRIGAIEHGVGHRLAHADVRDLRDDVIETLDVLNVDRGVDVDAAGHQLFDVEIALRVAAAFGIGVREFVDQNDLRPAGNDGVEIHLLKRLAFVFEAPAWNDFEAFQQRLGLLAAVGFDDTDDDIVPVLPAGMGLLQHFVCFANAGSSADKDSELADAAVLPACRCKQGFRRRPMFGVAPLIRHHHSDVPTFRRSAALSGGQAVEREIE